MSYFVNAMKNYANFKGRARRKELWIYLIVSTLISFVVTMIAIAATGGLDRFVDYETTGNSRTLFGMSPIALGIAAAVTVIFICPTIAVVVRRLHDTGHSALWILFLVAFYLSSFLTATVEVYVAAAAFAFLTFILGVTNFILIFIADSQHGENQYGPNPKGM